jgi:2-amino-4-hydroxy-6-hydroxymethyldihydropteridine diphosphokinase
MSVPELWIPACIGIGSNQDGPVAQVRAALCALAGLQKTRLIDASSLYRNPPMGPVEQPDYINAVAILLTRLSARELFAGLQALELSQGRVHDGGPRWGPRRIDLDVLTYGYRQIDEPDLVIPHPGISERNFVLLPLLEICPHWPIPGRGSVSRLAAVIDGTTLEKIPAQSQGSG